MLQDIKNRSDLEKIFTNFYKLAMNDPLIGHFFTEVVKLDLKTHLPHILNFWEANLWANAVYKKNVLKIHLNIHQKSKMEHLHFDQWVKILHKCVNNQFKGPFSEKLKTNALSIATVMKTKVI